MNVIVKDRVVVRVSGREPALRAEGAWLVPVALAVKGSEDGGLDFDLWVFWLAFWCLAWNGPGGTHEMGQRF